MNRFAPGTFTPDPRPASVPKMLAAQFGLELKLLLRNGEQLLLTMFIPITLLVGLTLLPLGSFGPNRAATFVPAIMALAVISTAFTGQAIAVAFDRRYGALKRLGATALPVWGIIAGKSLAVVAVVFLQSVLLGAIGFALGWRPNIAGLVLGAAIIALGTAGFAALGLLLGGTLRAEIVLADRQPVVVRLRRVGRVDAGGPCGTRGGAVGGPADAVGRADRGAYAGDDAVGGLVRAGGARGMGRGRRVVRPPLVPLHLTNPSVGSRYSSWPTSSMSCRTQARSSMSSENRLHNTRVQRREQWRTGHRRPSRSRNARRPHPAPMRSSWKTIMPATRWTRPPCYGTRCCARRSLRSLTTIPAATAGTCSAVLRGWAALFSG